MNQENERQTLEILTNLLAKMRSYKEETSQKEREKLRDEASILYGQVSDDLAELGVPRHYQQFGMTFSIFDTALMKMNQTNAHQVNGAIDLSIQTLQQAIGKMQRRVSQMEQGSPHRKKKRTSAHDTKKVFLVHGRDLALKHSVARVLERLGFKVIILDEQANEGKTVAEKFEIHADVSYAVILMTADDVGCLATEDVQSNLRPRARQNVILELGFFWGALGRENTSVICAGNPEFPSDISGLVYIDAANDGWKLHLGADLKRSGFDISLDDLI